jgi:hypothetical protein
MKTKDNVFLTFVHSSKLNYLPEQQKVMVAGESNFTFYAEGKSVVEINECQSRAIATVSDSFTFV